MSPDLRLRLHATQAQPCFPAASNALALPGGNGIFTATPTERLYRLSKSPRGIDVVSLTLGNSGLPFGDGLVSHIQLLGQLRLGQLLFLPQLFDDTAGYISVHGSISLL